MLNSSVFYFLVDQNICVGDRVGYSGDGSQRGDISLDNGDGRRNISRDHGDMWKDVIVNYGRYGSRSKDT